LSGIEQDSVRKWTGGGVSALLNDRISTPLNDRQSRPGRSLSGVETNFGENPAQQIQKIKSPIVDLKL